jgi:hypothetical protein
LGKTPFELLYGRQPRYFGITASDKIASQDIQAWLNERTLILASVRQHLLRMQQRMKHQADKHRTERSFEVGTEVFLRLQPYLETSVAARANHKLAFKFFGPFCILERVGQVAYHLDLPSSSKVHPVFHVSQLKQCVSSGHQVSPVLPSADMVFQILVQVLQHRVRQRGKRMVPQGLVQWSGSSPEHATWEDLESLQQQFPFAPAWGQAGFQDGRIVSDPPVHHRNTERSRDNIDLENRPRRRKQASSWLTRVT